MDYLSFSSDTQQSNASERERNRNLTDECQTKSLSSPCVRFAMFPLFLAISNFCTIQRLLYFHLADTKLKIEMADYLKRK